MALVDRNRRLSHPTTSGSFRSPAQAKALGQGFGGHTHWQGMSTMPPVSGDPSWETSSASSHALSEDARTSPGSLQHQHYEKPVKSQEAEIRGLKQRLQAADAAFKSAVKHAGALAAHKAALEQALAESSSFAVTVSSQCKAELAQQLAAAHAEAQAAAARQQQTERALADSQQQLHAAEQRCAAHAEVTAAQVADLQHQVQELQQRLQASEDESSQLQAELAQARCKINYAAPLSGRIAGLEAELAAQQAQEATLAIQVATLAAGVAEEQAQKAALADRLDEAAAATEVYVTFLTAAHAQIAELQALQAEARGDKSGSDADEDEDASDLIRFSQAEVALGTILGSGAYGIVATACVPGRQEPVAVKVPVDGHGEGLEAEARIGARLQHPNIVGVHGLVVRNLVCGVVMELAAGGTLTDIVCNCMNDGSPLTLQEVCQLFLGPWRALAWMHRQGYVHRDIKPDNLLADAQFSHDCRPQLKLADLGMAVELVDGQVPALPGGTMDFMAPEVARCYAAYEQGLADAATLPAGTAASDVWSMAVAMWVAYTGIFNTTAFIQDLLGKSLMDGATWQCGLPLPMPEGTPSDWALLIHACLSFDPAERPSAEEVVAWLADMQL